MKNFIKKHINKNTIWWLFVLFFSVSMTYASTSWTLWDLFEFISSWGENGNSVVNVYRLDWENIKDNTITSYEIKNWTIQSEDIWSEQITNLHIKDWTITTNDISNGAITENLLDSELAWSFWKWEENGDNIYYNSWSVWIWTDSPSSELEVVGNITSDLPTANSHVATKEYVDNVALAADTTDSNTSWWMTCYYSYPITEWCWEWFFQMPWTYVPTNRSSSIYQHIICCTQPETQKITVGWKSIYAFGYDWQHYMTTPSWCADKTDNPLCIWEDFVIKNQSQAVDYCNNLVYDWFDDWFLPSKIMLERMLDKLNRGNYWTSTFSHSVYYFHCNTSACNTGYTNGTSLLFRCVRQL